MAFLCTQTFLSGSGGTAVDGGKVLQDRIAHALLRITGKPGKAAKRQVADCAKADDSARPVTTVEVAGLDYAHSPRKANADRDCLKDEWKSIWKETTIEFSEEETGASIYKPNRRVRIGPFFLRPGFSVVDMEKVVLHEFIHAALAIVSPLPGIDHGFIDQALRNMGYKPPYNVAEQ